MNWLNKMKVINTKIRDLIIIEPTIYSDERGFFYELYNQDKYTNLGIEYKFVQDNRSRSTKNVMRGLHFQKKNPQGKLVTVTKGEVYDVAVDLRPGSETFGQYEALILSEENKKQFFIPPGFAHGFCVISEVADFYYKCTDFYSPADEAGIIWNDPDIKIDWPVTEPILSDKDKILPSFNEIKKQIISGW